MHLDSCPQEAGDYLDSRPRRPAGGDLQAIPSVDPIYGTAGRYAGAMGPVTDSTERKRAEERLNEAERLAQLGSWELDLVSNLFSWSDEHYRLFGLDPELGPLTLAAAQAPIHPEDRESARAIFEASLRTRQAYETTFRIVRPDGEVRVIHSRGAVLRDVSGRPQRMVGTVQDITERKQAEEELRESEQRLRALVASLDEVVFEFDGEGTYLSIWTNDESRLPLPGASLLGRRVTEVLGEEVAGPYLEAFRRVLQSGEPGMIEYPLKVGAGRRWFLSSISPVRAPDGTYRTVAMLARDITERKNLEEQLRQARKMEAVGRLAGGVAHDFNNLLTIIMGYTELLLVRSSEPDAFGSHLQEIKAAGERATSLVHQLLAFSRQQILEVRLLDLNAVVADTGRMLSRLIGEDIEVRIVLAPDPGLIKADAGRMSQVILNLAVNARDAMPEGGQLTIETANVDLDEGFDAEYADVRPGPYVMLTVSDTGTGMSAETQDHIFEPFFTTKSPGQGTGLGLSTVYGIVKQTGGHISVYSELDRGAAFKIYFPRVEGEPSALDAGAARGMAARGAETILVVEDEAGVRRLARAVLEGCGYTVLQAASGDEALAVFREHTGPIHLLLTDVVMPGLSGRELAERLKSAHSDLKVLFMSGYTGDAIVHHGVLAADTAFIGKPFSPIGLAEKVRDVLDARGQGGGLRMRYRRQSDQPPGR